MPNDLSKLIEALPDSRFTGGDFFALIIPDEIGKLVRLLEAIRKWRDIADQDIAELRKQTEESPEPWHEEYGFDPVAEEAFTLLRTERAMYGSLAVSITATVEWFIVAICKQVNVPCQDRQGRPSYGIARTNLGNAVGLPGLILEGNNDVKRIRILGNCFKHNDSRTNDDFVDEFGGERDDEIEYENEDWPGLIDAAKQFLEHLVRTF